MRRSTRRRPRRHRRLSRAPAAPAVVGRARTLARQSDAPAKFLSRRLLNNKGHRRRRPGTSSFDLSGCGLDYVVGDSFGIFARNDLGTGRPDHCAARASHTTKVRGKTLARGLARRRLAGTGAGFAVRTDLLSHRRHAARKARRWRRARIPMATRRRST